MLLPEGMTPQSRPKAMISTPTVMFSIFRSPPGFPVITALQPRTKFIAAYSCSEIIPKMAGGMPLDPANSPRQLMLRINKATPYRAWELITCLKRFRIHPIDHPPYSPDLEPSDFYIFENPKGVLAGQELDSTEELLLVIRWVTDSIGQAELESIFDAWERRLSECIKMKDESSTEAKSKVLVKIHIPISMPLDLLPLEQVAEHLPELEDFCHTCDVLLNVHIHRRFGELLEDLSLSGRLYCHFCDICEVPDDFDGMHEHKAGESDGKDD
jgi:hypothetical protein